MGFCKSVISSVAEHLTERDVLTIYGYRVLIGLEEQ